VPRRVSLPGADELFRRTSETPDPDQAVGPDEPAEPATPRPSGRQRHDEKITVYVSADELLHLERARLALRAEHGVAVDRGRIVREALAVVLADLDERGGASVLAERLVGRQVAADGAGTARVAP
jgi:hypothetical protein